MPTIEDQPRPRRHRSSAVARRGRRPGMPPMPVLLLACIAALLAARHAGIVGPDAAANADPAPGPTLRERAFDDARLRVPAGWVTLERDDEHVTWGSADRMHTVTLASIEASSAPLPTVVAAVTDEARALGGNARLLSEPRLLELDEPTGRGDSAMLVQLGVTASDGVPLEVAQVWRRDVRAGVDLVATWTSRDGTWPASPAREVPRSTGSR